VYKDKVELKKKAKGRIRRSIRKKISGTVERPRIFVFKSNRYVYVQVINDEDGKILTSASTLEKGFREKSKNYKNQEACQALGETLAKRLKEKKIGIAIFDRGIYPYHGRIKALADSIRKGGIIF
jgi:large subunit ribosomal protein L18